MSPRCAALAFTAAHLADKARWRRGRDGAVDAHGRPIHALSPKAVGRSLRGTLELAAAQGFRGKLKVRPAEPDRIEFDCMESADAYFALLLDIEHQFGAPFFNFEAFNESTTHAALMRLIAGVQARCGCEQGGGHD